MNITAWRIVQAKHVAKAFNGEGARLYGGRWNHQGTLVVYTAGTVSLATLEMLVHLETPQLLDAYVCIPAEFDAALCRKIDAAGLSPDWRDHPASASTRGIGTSG